MTLDFIPTQRRHRCEFCEKVFICHLCTIKKPHLLHATRAHLADESVFVCLGCATDHGLLRVYCANTVKHWTTTYDYVTGRRLRRRKHHPRPNYPAQRQRRPPEKEEEAKP